MNNLPYVVAVVIVVMAGVLGIVIVTIARPTQDNTAVYAVIVGFIAPTTLSLLAFMKAQETHLAVNSRLDTFLAIAKFGAHAQGLSEGRAEGRQAADTRTDQLRADHMHEKK